MTFSVLKSLAKIVNSEEVESSLFLRRSLFHFATPNIYLI